MSETAIENIEVKETEVDIVNPYPLRNLQAKDVFIFSTVMKQIGWAKIKECFNISDVKSMMEGKTAEEYGMTIMFEISNVVISNLASAEESIYQLLSNLSGKTKAEIANLDAEIFMAMIIDVFKQDGFKNFFKVVSKLFK